MNTVGASAASAASIRMRARHLKVGADFLPRLASALVLGPLVVLLTWWGGFPFEIMVVAAAIGVLWEWLRMAGAFPRNTLLIIGSFMLILAVLVLHVRPAPVAMSVILLGAIASALIARGGRTKRPWAPAGMIYAGALALAPISLRGDAQLGLVSLVWLFAVVWSTDIAAYFCGRLIGGAKLWPRVSPNKTWSGALGGALFGTLAGMLVLYLAGVSSFLLAAPVAFVVSVTSQGGDLFESAMKRRFGVKDSSGLIPGHGGLMDRLDGFITGAALALLIGIVRDAANPAQGLLIW